MEIMREDINISRSVAKGSTKTVCDGNIIVPDKKPDILKVVWVDSRAAITDKTVRDGKISLSGKVYLTVLYIPDTEDKGVTSINSSFDFSETVPVPGVEEGMKIIASTDVSRVDYSIINSRKLHIKNIVALSYEVIEIKNTEIPTGVESDTAQVKTDTVKIKNTYDVCDHEFTVNEKISLLAGQGDVADILKTDVEITDTEYKAITGRVILKGIITVRVLYVSADGEIEHTESEMPFTEVVESENTLDNMDCDIEYFVLDIDSAAEENPDGDMRYIAVNAGISVIVRPSAREDICIISDCYVPGKKTEIKSEKITVEENVLTEKEQSTVRDICDFSERVKGVYNVVMSPGATKADMAGERVVLEGKIDVYVLYLSEGGESPVNSLHHQIPYAITFDTNVPGDDITVKPQVKIKHSGYTLNAAGEVELRCILEAGADMVRNTEIDIIDDIITSEPENSGASIVIYFTQKGDSVWNIAKRYSVPVDNILKYNDIDGNKSLKAGERIFISCK